jgi:hypothetical protein
MITSDIMIKRQHFTAYSPSGKERHDDEYAGQESERELWDKSHEPLGRPRLRPPRKYANAP